MERFSEKAIHHFFRTWWRIDKSLTATAGDLVVATVLSAVLRLGQVVPPGGEFAVFAAVALVGSTVHLWLLEYNQLKGPQLIKTSLF